MDNPGGPPEGISFKRQRPRGSRRNVPSQNPQLFDDTSNQPYGQAPMDVEQPSQAYDPVASQQHGYPHPGGYAPPPQQGYESPPGQYGQAGMYQPPSQPQFPGQQFLQDPVVTNMAMQYGEVFANQGRDFVQQNIEKYVPTSKLKYYFAVDTAYVGKKIGLLLFPYAHADWSIRYNQDQPVAPRYEINAPDLYIPVMAFVTYVLVAGVMLGTNNRFTPEQLGITCSSAFVWLIIEILLLVLMTYILNVSTELKYLDLLAYCGYKYVGMIASLLAGMLFSSSGYYLVLLWASASLAFFLVRTLKLAIIPHADADAFTKGNKRRLYMLLTIALSQPLFMWWLTSHLLVAGPGPRVTPPMNEFASPLNNGMPGI